MVMRVSSRMMEPTDAVKCPLCDKEVELVMTPIGIGVVKCDDCEITTAVTFMHPSTMVELRSFLTNASKSLDAFEALVAKLEADDPMVTDELQKEHEALCKVSPDYPRAC